MTRVATWSPWVAVIVASLKGHGRPGQSISFLLLLKFCSASVLPVLSKGSFMSYLTLHFDQFITRKLRGGVGLKHVVLTYTFIYICSLIVPLSPHRAIFPPRLLFVGVDGMANWRRELRHHRLVEEHIHRRINREVDSSRSGRRVVRWVVQSVPIHLSAGVVLKTM